MVLNNLIVQNGSNPYNLWPEVNFEQITALRIEQITNDEKTSEVFCNMKDGVPFCYFQLHNLKWDSNHFGFKCCQIKHFYIDETLSFDEIENILKTIKPRLINYLKKNSLYFISADINSQSKNGNYFIQLLGFQYILNWINGFYSTSKKINVEIDYKVGLIKPNEVKDVSLIALKDYYKGGRFYSDKCFDVKRVGKLYESIIQNSYSNNDVILILRINEKPVGAFISKPVIEYEKFNNLKVAHLRFLVIDEKYRKMSIGKSLFLSTIKYFQDKSDLIVTGLESHNLVSMNLHSKLGFKYNYSHNAYHLWTKNLI